MKRSGTLSEAGLAFRSDFTNKHTQKREFRQALAFLFSFEDMVDANAGAREPETYQVGMHKLTYDEWLSDSFKEELIQYGPGAKPQKAVSRMQSAGYERNNSGNWVGPDGDQVSFKIKSRNGDTIASMETAVDAMNSFGFETSVETGGNSALWSMNDTESWDLEMSLFLAGPNGHPVTTFRKISWWHRLTPSWKFVGEGEGGLGDNDSYVKAQEGDEDVTGYANRPLTAEVPTTVGQLDPDGDTKTIEWDDYVSRLKSPETSDENWQQALEDMAWRANYLADPIVPYSFVTTSYHNDENFAFPDLSREDIGIAAGVNSPQKYNILQGIAYGRQK